MNRHELARLGQYFKDMGREGCGHGVAADASKNVLEGIGAVILKFAAAPDNLPKDDDPRFVKMKNYAWRVAAMLRFLKEHQGECLGDHPDWIEKIDALLNETPG